MVLTFHSHSIGKLDWFYLGSVQFQSSIEIFTKFHWNQGNFHGWASKFGGKRIDSGSLQWAFRSANHGWKSFLTLNSFPAHSRYFKNLKSTWHKTLSCSCQLQTIFWSPTPHLHVLIMIWNVYVSQKDGVFKWFVSEIDFGFRYDKLGRNSGFKILIICSALVETKENFDQNRWVRSITT